jgi:hypothetical protein
MDAWSDDSDQGAFICQATQGAWRSDVIDGDQLAEWFDDANEDHRDPDGDAPSVCMSAEKWQGLADRMNRVLKAAIQQEGLLAWGFTSQTESEWVDIPTAWAAAEAAALVTNVAASAAHADEGDVEVTPALASLADVEPREAAE